MRSILVAGCAFLCSLAVNVDVACAADEEEKKITFEEHIKPIFREHCTACHSEGDKESDLALDTYGATLTGGSSGEVIAEGNASGSRLFALMTHAERPFMPPDQDPIAKEQIDLVKTWIEQGMPENSGSKIKRSNSAAAAMLGSVSQGKPEGPPPMPETLLKQPVIETERSAAISAMAGSPWAPLIAVGGQQQVLLYHAQSGDLLGVLPFPEGEPQSLTFTRDGRQLLIGGGRHSHSGCAVLVDIATGKRITKVGDELDTVMAADISPDKSRIALAGPQKMVRIYNSLTGELVVEMKKHTDWIFALRYSPDGVLLASADRSNGLVVWEADTGRPYSELTGHRDEIRALDFRGDSNVLASASLDGTIKLWDMFESKEIKSWNAHGGGATSVAFTQSGLLATCGRDQRVKLWDGNGGLKSEFKGLTASALEVAVTGDGTSVAGGDWNGAVQLWQAADPATTKLISANPPSIEKRLALANEELGAKQSLFAKSKSAADAAAAASEAAKSQLGAAQSTVDSLATKVSESTIKRDALAKQVGSFDAKIKQLEAQLAEVRTQRTDAQSQLTQTTQQIAQFQSESKAAAASLTTATTRHEQLVAAAKTSAEALKQAESQLAVAQQAADKAKADKDALDARAAALRAENDKTTKALQAITQQLEGAVADQAKTQTDAEALAEQLQELKTQLAKIQSQVEAASNTHQQLTKDLATKQSTTTELQDKLETAQQAASDAQAELDLFEQSYRKPE